MVRVSDAGVSTPHKVFTTVLDRSKQRAFSPHLDRVCVCGVCVYYRYRYVAKRTGPPVWTCKE